MEIIVSHKINEKGSNFEVEGIRENVTIHLCKISGQQGFKNFYFFKNRENKRKNKEKKILKFRKEQIKTNNLN